MCCSSFLVVLRCLWLFVVSCCCLLVDVCWWSCWLLVGCDVLVLFVVRCRVFFVRCLLLVFLVCVVCCVMLCVVCCLGLFVILRCLSLFVVRGWLLLVVVVVVYVSFWGIVLAFLQYCCSLFVVWRS